MADGEALDAGGERAMMTSRFGPVGKLQGLIITHQDTPTWSEFGDT